MYVAASRNRHRDLVDMSANHGGELLDTARPMGSKRPRDKCQHGMRSTVTSIATMDIWCNHLPHEVHMPVHPGTRYTQAFTEKKVVC